MTQLTFDKITKIYCIADDFRKEFSKGSKNAKFFPMMANSIKVAYLACPMLKLLPL
jgi:hypothetical protein